MSKREQPSVTSVKALKRAIEVGLAQLRRGEGIDAEAFFRRLMTRRRRKKARGS